MQFLSMKTFNSDTYTFSQQGSCAKIKCLTVRIIYTTFMFMAYEKSLFEAAMFMCL